MNDELEIAVRDFSRAETALREILDNVEALRASRSTVESASATLQAAGASVSRSHESLQDLASRLADSGDALRVAAQQAGTAATALAAVEPERLVATGEQTQAEVHKLGTRLQQVVEARTSAVTDAVVASINSTRGETSTEVREVTVAISALNLDLVAVKEHVELVAKRQTQLLALCSVLVILVLVAAVGAFMA